MGDFSRVKIDRSAPYDLFGTAVQTAEETCGGCRFRNNETSNSCLTAKPDAKDLSTHEKDFAPCANGRNRSFDKNAASRLAHRRLEQLHNASFARPHRVSAA